MIYKRKWDFRTNAKVLVSQILIRFFKIKKCLILILLFMKDVKHNCKV